MPRTAVTLGSWKRADFDQKKVRKAVRRAGADVQKTARRIVNRKGQRSGPGEFPGRRTGGLFRAIKSKMKGPFVAVIGPRKTAEMDDYYPAFLASGTDRMEPRADVMDEALTERRPGTIRSLEAALADSLRWLPSK